MKRLFKIATALGVVGGSFGMAVFCATVLYLNPKLPSVDVLKESNLQVPLRIYSQNGTLIGEYGEKFRTPVDRSELPDSLVQALLAAEDDRFLEHRGIDIAGLLRAASELVTSGRIVTGGSTITMQVARNYFLTSEQTFIRKFKEILLAIKIEQSLSKDEILELYVNKIYLGKRAYGVQAAAAIYYGTSIAKLDLAQIAMIAGLPKAPSSYNPVNNPERAKIRRDWILGRMLSLGYIGPDEHLENINKPITARYYGPKLQLDAGYPAEMARRFALDRYGEQAYNNGYKVITTISDEAQIAAQSAVQKGLRDYTERHGYRGPEQRLGEQALEAQLEALEALGPVNTLQAALILAIESSELASIDQRLQLRLSDGSETELLWSAKAQPLRKYITENRRSAPLTKLDEVLQVGDIIRIWQDDEQRWQLGQLPTASASLIALRPANGSLAAVVGGFDHRQSQFNRATQAYRQPGSNFKPFVYAAALENDFTAASIINDAPIVFNDDQLETRWRPENSSGKFYGPTTLRKALYLSRNLVSVRLLRELGIDKAIRYLRQFELGGGKLPRDLSLALGSHALTPIEVATLYAAIANGGFLVEPYLVSEIRDRNDRLIYAASPTLACADCAGDSAALANMTDTGNSELETSDSEFDEMLEEAAGLDEILDADAEQTASADLADNGEILGQPRLAKQVIQTGIAYILDDILRDVIQRGTATKARALDRDDLAGKTGTTNGPTDAWFSGYHPELVATSWLGFDDNSKIGRREFGGTAALPIWIDFMQSQLPSLPYARRTQPQDVIAVRIDTETGELANAASRSAEFEYFINGTAPSAVDRFDSSAGGSIEFDTIEEELF